MASAEVLVTKPWQVPPSYASWVTLQSFPMPSVWHSVGMWKAWTKLP